MKNGGGVAEEETMVFVRKQGKESCWAGLSLTVVLKPDPRLLLLHLHLLLPLGITPNALRAEIDKRPPDDRAESKGGAQTLQHTGILRPPEFHNKSDTRRFNRDTLIVSDFVVCRSATHHL